MAPDRRWVRRISAGAGADPKPPGGSLAAVVSSLAAQVSTARAVVARTDPLAGRIGQLAQVQMRAADHRAIARL